jgi:hypothetical protein
MHLAGEVQPQGCSWNVVEHGERKDSVVGPLGVFLRGRGQLFDPRWISQVSQVEASAWMFAFLSGDREQAWAQIETKVGALVLASSQFTQHFAVAASKVEHRGVAWDAVHSLHHPWLEATARLGKIFGEDLVELLVKAKQVRDDFVLHIWIISHEP